METNHPVLEAISTATTQQGLRNVQAPKVSLPSGGGAMRSIAEPFKSESFTGGAGYTLDIPLPTGRGFSPSISLHYSSGGGVGIFGLGFELGLMSISRKTAIGVPTYTDQDVFLLGGAELTPAMQWDAESEEWRPLTRQWTEADVVWEVVQYRPRVEAGFDKIEQWTDAQTGVSHWRILTADNTMHLLGDSDASRISDRADPTHIFEWLIASSRDAHGNRIEYQYRPGDRVGIPDTLYNQGRDFSSQRYPWIIRFGNYLSTTPAGQEEKFAFEVCFDYGQIDPESPGSAWGEWTARPDPFSFYNSGFEIRTARLCRGIYVRHRFEEVGDQPFVTAAVLLEHFTAPYGGMSLLVRATQRGFGRKPDGSPWVKDMPAVEMHYQDFDPTAQQWRTLEADAPGYMTSQGFLPADLHGVGMDGLLYSTDTFTGYLAPLGNGRYAPMRELKDFPLSRSTASGEVTLTSLNGNHLLDLVVQDLAQSGFFPQGTQLQWESFRAFPLLPEDFSNPEKEWVDLSGSGRADILVQDNEGLRNYPSLGAAGFAEAQLTRRPLAFPVLSPAGEDELVGFASFLGDGLSHRFRIRNGSVEIWPSLGHGHFGECVQMDNAPFIAEGMRAASLFLLDADGSGTTDVAYLFPDKLRIWLNQCGNSFNEPIDIPLPGMWTSITQVTAGDVTGYGTASVLFTLPSPEVRHLFYDFGGSHKPYLMVETDNGIGAKTVVRFTTSVQEWLRDQQEGRPWVTRLPLNVHLVEQSQTHELVTGAIFTHRCRYHDGYFDPVERAFRGFGYVETWDCERYEEFVQQQESRDVRKDELLWVPPIYTRSWFLTGAYEQRAEILAQYKEEYFQGDAEAWQLSPIEWGAGWNSADAVEMQQAYAALAGQALRSEVYAEDSSSLTWYPYTVSQSAAEVRLIQPCLGQRYCAVQVLAQDALSYAYDRNPRDPVISQDVTLLRDAFGHPLLTAQVAYPRRMHEGITVYPEQLKLHCIVSGTGYINALPDPQVNPDEAWQWLGVAWQSKQYEVGGLTAPVQAPFTHAALLEQVKAALANPVTESEAVPPSQPWSRLLGWGRSYFWNDQETAALPAGQINSLALLHHTEEAVMTQVQLEKVFQGKVTNTMLTEDCGYVQDEGYWWNRGLVQYYLRGAGDYHLPWRTANPWAAKAAAQGGKANLDVETTVEHDPYRMMVVRESMHLTLETWLTSSYANDYFAMAPWQSTDANQNVTEVLLDPLGQVVVSTRYGTEHGEAAGDLPLSSYKLQPPATLQDVVEDPHKFLQGASAYYFYDLHAWQAQAQPTSAASLVRNDHVQALLAQGRGEDDTLVQVSISYADGLGRTLQQKARTSPGPVTLEQEEGQWLNPEVEKPTQKPSEVPDRWIVTGRTVYNNKGLPVEQYQPFFSRTYAFEDQQEIIDQGLVPPPSILHYDALGRVIRTITSKGYVTRVEMGPWMTKEYDTCDTLPESPYYQWLAQQMSGDPPAWLQAEWEALRASLPFVNTPHTIIHDNLGHIIRKVLCNLGAVSPDNLPVQVAAPLTPAEAWQRLVHLGFLLEEQGTATQQAWVSSTFQPYTQGFAETFEAHFPLNDGRLFLYLTEHCPTTLQVSDVQGRVLAVADARLHLQNVTEGTRHFNYEQSYDLMGATLASRSADAGTRWNLMDIYGDLVYGWDSREFVIQHQYDRLRRLTSTTVTGGDGSVPLDNVTEVIVYGESASNAADFNLMGCVYQHYDEAGLKVTQAMSLGGQPQQGYMHLRPDYRTEANWTSQAQQDILHTESFTASCTYNALGNPLTETLPDGSQQRRQYDRHGRLLALEQRISSSDDWQPVITHISYDANGDRTLVSYGNGVRTRHQYEATTQLLVRTLSSRDASESSPPEVLQDLQYTYDPEGHISSKYDRVAPVVYHHNQQVLPRSTYRYDALYRLVQATGRHLMGLTQEASEVQEYHAGTWQHAGKLGNLQQVEQYTESFAYDLGDNMVLRQLSSGQRRTQHFQITEGCNRLLSTRWGSESDEPRPLRALTYDAAGNALQLLSGGTATVKWNYRNSISAVVSIARTLPDAESDTAVTADDAEYYLYDTQGNRSKKVTERWVQGGTQLEVTEKIYLGAWQRQRTWTVPRSKALAAEAPAPTSERHTLLLSDGHTPVLITHVWVVAPPHQDKVQAGDVQHRYQLCDPLNSVTMELTEQAEVLTYEQYYAYGGRCYVLARSQLEADSKELRFCGKERDQGTGLYYMAARYYAVHLCRWMSPDPAGPVDGLNLYEYCGGNPVNYHDPTGKARGPKKVVKKPGAPPTPKERWEQKAQTVWGVWRTLSKNAKFRRNVKKNSKAAKLAHKLLKIGMGRSLTIYGVAHSSITSRPSNSLPGPHTLAHGLVSKMLTNKFNALLASGKSEQDMLKDVFHEQVPTPAAVEAIIKKEIPTYPAAGNAHHLKITKYLKGYELIYNKSIDKITNAAFTRPGLRRMIEFHPYTVYKWKTTTKATKKESAGKGEGSALAAPNLLNDADALAKLVDTGFKSSALNYQTADVLNFIKTRLQLSVDTKVIDEVLKKL